ncbi:MAG: AAA family ATPase, partial [Bilophila sp.]
DGLLRDQGNGVAVEDTRLAELQQKIGQYTDKAADLERTWLTERAAAQAFIAARSAMIAAAEGADGKKPEVSVQTEETNAAPEALPADTTNTVTPREAFLLAKQTLETLRGADGLTHVEVTPDVVAQVVADWTGIPVGKLAQQQAGITQNLATLLARRIKGQDAALAAITRAIQASTAGLRSPDQPLGVFLLVGPSGVGKTETGLVLADILFGDERSVVSVNMSEFQEKHTVSRLIGSPPGYIGYGEGGMLTEAVRRRPYSVVLLDEVEKAHIDVMNLFYQVFDKGTLTDGEGKEVSFKNTIILLTSNLASDVIQECTADDSDTDSQPPMDTGELSASDSLGLDVMLSAIRPLLSEHFRPALLARMNVVPYRTLAASALRNITELKLNSLSRRLAANNGMTLTYTPAVVEQIVSRCTETEVGARNIEYILSGTVLPRLSQNILAHMSGQEMPSCVQLDSDAEGHFSTNFS